MLFVSVMHGKANIKYFPVHNVRRMGGAELQMHSFLILALDEAHEESSRDIITKKMRMRPRHIAVKVIPGC